jgi:hypothetical protein
MKLLTQSLLMQRDCAIGNTGSFGRCATEHLRLGETTHIRATRWDLVHAASKGKL